LTGDQDASPLGDPIPFSAYLIGRLANDTGFATQYNLDSDRAFAYLTWDWNRQDAKEGKDAFATTDLGFRYVKPVVAPQGSVDWDLGRTPLQLHYVDPPPKRRSDPIK
jgi:hypothetical protein